MVGGSEERGLINAANEAAAGARRGRRTGLPAAEPQPALRWIWGPGRAGKGFPMCGFLWELPHLAGRAFTAQVSSAAVLGAQNLNTEPGKRLELSLGFHSSQKCGFVGFQPHSVTPISKESTKLNLEDFGELMKKFITESLLKTASAPQKTSFYC